MNVFQKLIAKIVKKSVSDIVSNPEVVSHVLPSDEGKRNIWKFVIQTLISILTAILTALGATSCMGLH